MTNPPKNSKDLPSPHDTFFKFLFGNLQNIKDFLSTFFPQLSKHLVLNSVELKPTEKFSHLRNQSLYLDLVVKAKMKGQDLHIYLIFEHKANPDREVYLQLLRYKLACWEEDLKHKRPYTPILAIIFYQGKNKWPYPMKFSEFFPTIPKELKDHHLDFEPFLFDLTKIKNEDLQRLISRNRILRMGLEVLKRAQWGNKEDFLTLLEDLEDLLREHKAEYGEEVVLLAEMSIIYLQRAFKMSAMEVEKMLQKRREKFKSIIDVWVERGIKQGIKQGIQQGLIINTQDLIIEALEERFGPIPASWKERIKKIEDLEYLKKLHRAAVKVNTLKEMELLFENSPDEM